ncbi:hypothetical protein AVEN_253715-1 [Araneus ventricosus]|uniref:Histone-lysine N-methyltransferase SETMAR n=1 Tax=Araneus ventricosus TaxID=182803 RepID=A0A4Y2DVI9_ARAVE|nr:hypothetical protein AVEN_253715-1 [Araneus ventricosus]
MACREMASSSCIGNTQTAHKTRELLQKFKWEKVRSRSPYSPDLASNLGFIHLSRTRFASDSDVKTLAQWVETRFLPSRVKDKYLKRFGDYVEK